MNEKLKIYASIIDYKTEQQAIETSQMPFIKPYLALMPDAHLGMGATVGSVIPTDGAIMPAAVGVDIGCGMIAWRLNITKDDCAEIDLHELRVQIERAVPLSAGSYNRKIVKTAVAKVAELEKLAEDSGFDPASYAKNWQNQLGSLGSGNHFIEVSSDEEGRVWLFLHSGSRGVGNKIAMSHTRIAQRIAKQEKLELPNTDLAYLTEGTQEFERYIAELRWAQRFAELNREEMMERVLRQVTELYPDKITVEEKIACHHNYTEQEEIDGKLVWLSRKGAISAREGDMGLIPGSMGDKSYIVEGLGNPEGLYSAPHGAGRVLSRTEARKKYNHDDLRKAMGDSVEYRDTAEFIDEIPQAYKPIDQVMEDAKELVKVRHTLKQFVNVKGD